MNQEAQAAIVFAEAQRAFDSRDYQTAVGCAERARALLQQTRSITNYGLVSSNPTYSIVIVLYDLQPRFAEALAHLISYSEQDLYELIFVNNGKYTAKDLIFNSLKRYQWIEVGFNSGCSGGRSLGASFAKGDYVIFLDDDGILERNAVENLIEVITEYDAVSVRGRVRAKSPGGLVGPHYDPGDEILYSVPNAEGISIWRRQAFIDHGGFDILLAGREGLAIWSKMYPWYGPDAFLYTPDAVLLHDYAGNEADAARKQTRLEQNDAYLSVFYPRAIPTKSMLYDRRRAVATRIAFQRGWYQVKRHIAPASGCRVSVLTTGGGDAPHLEDYTKALKSQTHRDFEVIFVADKSSPNLAERIVRLWRGDDRLRLLTGTGGRSVLLNLAATHANNDVCVIADADDISHRRRLEFTSSYFVHDKGKGCLGFASFNEKLIHGTPFPDVTSAVGIKTRSLLGMPVSFPAFAFRKSQFELPFDPSVSDSIGCIWIYQNLRRHSIDGIVIPLNQVFHRQNEVTDKSQDRSVELYYLYLSHEELVGTLSEKNKLCARILAGWDTPTMHAHIWDVQVYGLTLIARNAKLGVYEQVEMEQLLLQRLSQLENGFFRARYDKYRAQRDELRKQLEEKYQFNWLRRLPRLVPRW